MPPAIGWGPSIDAMGVQSFDQVGAVVDDLEAVSTFSLDLGFAITI